MMRVGWRRVSQQCLQQPLHMGGRQQILTTRDQIDALVCVIHHHRQMIGGRQILARQHHVSEQQRIDRMGVTMLDESERARRRSSFGGVQPQRIGRALARIAFGR